MKYQLRTAALITSEFVIFMAVSIVLFLQHDPVIPGSLIIKSSLLAAALLVIVLLTVLQGMKQRDKTISELESSLTSEQSSSHKLQVQFEETIEKRTLELQVTNGALNREIAERTQAEEELRELQKQLNLILESAGEGILGLDNHGKVVFINRAASLMLGWETEELLGSKHHEMIHHTHPDGTSHPVENCPIYMAYRDGQVHYKTGDVFWCKNGTSFPVEYVSTPIRDRGMLTGAVVVFRDMNTYK